MRFHLEISVALTAVLIVGFFAGATPAQELPAAKDTIFARKILMTGAVRVGGAPVKTAPGLTRLKKWSRNKSKLVPTAGYMKTRCACLEEPDGCNPTLALRAFNDVAKMLNGVATRLRSQFVSAHS